MRAKEVRGVLNDYYFLVSCIILPWAAQGIKVPFTEEGKIEGAGEN